MQATISKWGNSLALRLPRHVADQVRLVEGATVDLEVGEDGTLKVIPSRKKFKLADLLDGHPKRDRSANQEVEWGDAKGDEAW